MKYTIPTTDTYEKLGKVMEKVKTLEELQSKVKGLENEIEKAVEESGLESFCSKVDFFDLKKPSKKTISRKQSTTIHHKTLAKVLKSPMSFKDLLATLQKKEGSSLTEEQLRTDLKSSNETHLLCMWLEKKLCWRNRHVLRCSIARGVARSSYRAPSAWRKVPRRNKARHEFLRRTQGRGAIAPFEGAEGKAPPSGRGSLHVQKTRNGQGTEDENGLQD